MLGINRILNKQHMHFKGNYGGGTGGGIGDHRPGPGSTGGWSGDLDPDPNAPAPNNPGGAIPYGSIYRPGTVAHWKNWSDTSIWAPTRRTLANMNIQGSSLWSPNTLGRRAVPSAVATTAGAYLGQFQSQGAGQFSGIHINKPRPAPFEGTRRGAGLTDPSGNPIRPSFSSVGSFPTGGATERTISGLRTNIGNLDLSGLRSPALESQNFGFSGLGTFNQNTLATVSYTHLTLPTTPYV